MTNWVNASGIESASFTCGFCGNVVASAIGYGDSHRPYNRIRICPHCHNPTIFGNGTQIPQVAPGNEVTHLPEDVENLYREARKLCICFGIYLICTCM